MVTPKRQGQDTSTKRPRRACAPKRKLQENGETPANGTVLERAPAPPAPKKRRSKYSDVPPAERLEQIRVSNCGRTAKSRMAGQNTTSVREAENGNTDVSGTANGSMDGLDDW